MKALLNIFKQSNASFFEICHKEVLFLSVSMKMKTCSSGKLEVKLLSLLEELCIAGHTLIMFFKTLDWSIICREKIARVISAQLNEF